MNELASGGAFYIRTNDQEFDAFWTGGGTPFSGNIFFVLNS